MAHDQLDRPPMPDLGPEVETPATATADRVGPEIAGLLHLQASWDTPDRQEPADEAKPETTESDVSAEQDTWLRSLAVGNTQPMNGIHPTVAALRQGWRAPGITSTSPVLGAPIVAPAISMRGGGGDSSSNDKPGEKGKPKQEGELDVFESFGEAVRYGRRTFAERMFDLPAGVAPPELSSRKLIACLTEHGYPISSGAFSSIESGNSLPRDPEGFLRALFACLGLNANEGLGRAMTLHLAYDLLRRDLGKYAGLLEQVVPEEFRRRMQKKPDPDAGPGGAVS